MKRLIWLLSFLALLIVSNNALSFTNRSFANPNSVDDRAITPRIVEEHPLLQAFELYEKEYWTLDEECVRMTPRGTMALINAVNCVWRKDKLLMASHGLDPYIYSEAAERYSAIFELAKSTSILSQSSNSSGLMEQFVWNKITTADDYLKLQKLALTRHLQGF